MSFEIREKTWSLSQEQLSFYRLNGYLIVQKLFSEEECDAIKKSIRQHANEDFAAIMNPDRPEELAKQAPFSSRESVLQTSRFFRNIMKDPRYVTIVEMLQGKEMVGLMSQMLFKEVGTKYAAQAWNPHQDNAYPRNPNNQYITMNLFLADAERENGSMYVYPGSHQEDLLPFKSTVSYREEDGRPGNLCEIPEKYTRVDLSFRRGDLLILHGNTIHGSYSDLSQKRSRPLFSCSYITKGETFIPGETAKRMAIPLH